MDYLEEHFRQEGIEFSSEGNHGRCFPNVINLAVQAILNGIKTHGGTLCCALPDITTPHKDEHEAYAAALDTDPVGCVRNITIRQGNDSEVWPERIPERQLTRDCETRWSSTSLMLERVLDANEALKCMFCVPKYQQAGLHTLLLNKDQYTVTCDIEDVLRIPHHVQELLSAEKTPTLPVALPAYEQVLLLWRALQIELQYLSPYIEFGISKIEEYVARSRRSCAYVLAIVINPAIKFRWIEDQWTEEECEEARRWVIDTLTQFRRQQCIHEATNVPESSTDLPTTMASLAQGRGFLNLRNTSRRFRRTAGLSASSSESDLSVSQTRTSSTSYLQSAGSTADSAGDLNRLSREALEADDRKRALREFDRYCEEPVVQNGIENGLDLLRYWQINKHSFPLLYRVALDILPAQASSVACERLFSSAKETDTLRRNRLSPAVMEALQFLK
ncbi:hATC-domain-containing protein, partial [Punctularia strigosozonata HHB-11173 SS5]